METVYTDESFPCNVTKSIFLAGPTPRSPEVTSWRPEALQILAELGYDGHVFVPEYRDAAPGEVDYKERIDWETEGLNRADCIVFWVPRNLKTMPAFTTNVEFGAWTSSGKVIFGAPADAPKNRHLELKADEMSVPRLQTLKKTLAQVCAFLGEGSSRQNGECQVPLQVWRTESFQAWYKNLKKAGNRLDGARLLWSYRTGRQKSFIFLWILKVNVWVAREERNKTNEFVIARTDTASVMLWYEHTNPFDSEIVLVREFRSPARTEDGFIHELPGGSTFADGVSPSELVFREAKEETSFTFDPRRLIAHGSRQVAGTLSTHHAHLFSLRLTPAELEELKMLAAAGTRHGNTADSEQTYVEIKTLGEIMDSRLVDWATLGMILGVIFDGK